MLNKAPLVVAGTILPTLYVAMAFSGLVFVYENGWCASGEFCSEAWKMLRLTLESTVTASIAGFFCFWGMRTSLANKRTFALVTIGLVCSLLLFVTFLFAVEIRAELARQYFPYVISLRFGYLGIFIVWGTISLIVCATVMAVVVRMENLTIRSRRDAP
jgi:hypothetical protein